jgi:hypothetical protein
VHVVLQGAAGSSNPADVAGAEVCYGNTGWRCGIRAVPREHLSCQATDTPDNNFSVTSSHMHGSYTLAELSNGVQEGREKHVVR